MFVESGNKSFVSMVELNLYFGFQTEETFFFFFSALSSCKFYHSPHLHRALEFIGKSDCIYPTVVFWVHNP